MRTLRLALLPAAWFANAGAAPIQDSQMRAAAECRLPPAAMLAAAKRFTVDRVVDDGVPPDRRITRFYKSPPGFDVHGYPLVFLAAADIVTSDNERFLLMATVKGPYADVERSVLAANNEKSCPSNQSDADGEGCGVYARQIDGWRVAVVLKQYGENVGIACSLSREPQ